MAFAPLQELFKLDLRLWDDHTKFDGHWSDEQLEPIVERLGLRGPLSYAIASFARTVVFEAKTTNLGTHYSRAKDWYGYRYNDTGDPYCTYWYMTPAADWLKANGYIEHLQGEYNPCKPGAGRESVAYATEKLLDTIGDLADPLEPRALATKPEVIILKDADGKYENYRDTGETRAMRKQMWVFHDQLANRALRRHGQVVEVPIIRRVFNRGFDRGGRLYCHGDSFQQLSQEERAEITEIINGEAQPFVEIDFPAHHYNLAYAQEGKKVSGDPYDIPGFGRKLVKLAGLIAFNAANKTSAAGALVKETGCALAEARAVLRAVRRKHYRIKGYFFSDSGARLMRTDSDMSVEIMKRVMARTGRCPLPMHDSYLVPACDANVLAAAMDEVAEEYGVPVLGGRPALALRAAPVLDPQTNPPPTSNPNPLPNPNPLHTNSTTPFPNPHVEVISSELLIYKLPQTSPNTPKTAPHSQSAPPHMDKGPPDPQSDLDTDK